MVRIARSADPIICCQRDYDDPHKGQDRKAAQKQLRSHLIFLSSV
jgi:hypothetical protein